MRTGLGCVECRLFASVFRRVGPVEQRRPLALAQGKFHGISHAAAVARFRNQPVDYQIDCSDACFYRVRADCREWQIRRQPADAKPSALSLRESLLLRSFCLSTIGAMMINFSPSGRGQDFGDYLVYVAGSDWPAALRAINRAQAREKRRAKIMGLGYRAHGGSARISCQPLLFQEMAGERPSIFSTSGLSICGRNCLAYAERDST